MKIAFCLLKICFSRMVKQAILLLHGLGYNPEKLGKIFSDFRKLPLSPTIIVGGHGIPRIGNNAKIAYRLFTSIIC